MKKSALKLKTFMAAAALFTGLFISCREQNPYNSIAVFVPGIIADSPTYAHVVNGITKAVEDANKSSDQKWNLKIMEIGTNQSEWASKLTALCATGEYGLIVSSNPSLPELAEPLTKQFPKQKFLLLDAASEGNENMYCISYNQKEQTYLAGYVSALMSKSHKIGLIAAQEYPVMNNILFPYYAKGASDAVPGTTADFRIVGNWYDGTKGAEVCDALVQKNVDVVLPICGGAAQGVISSAKEHGIKLAFIDENSFAKLPGSVICSVSTGQEKASYEALNAYMKSEIPWGTTKVVGLKEGYINYLEDDPLYITSVPEEIREKMSALLKKLTDEGIE